MSLCRSESKGRSNLFNLREGDLNNDVNLLLLVCPVRPIHVSGRVNLVGLLRGPQLYFLLQSDIYQYMWVVSLWPNLYPEWVYCSPRGREVLMQIQACPIRIIGSVFFVKLSRFFFFLRSSSCLMAFSANSPWKGLNTVRNVMDLLISSMWRSASNTSWDICFRYVSRKCLELRFGSNSGMQ